MNCPWVGIQTFKSNAIEDRAARLQDLRPGCMRLDGLWLKLTPTSTIPPQAEAGRLVGLRDGSELRAVNIS